MIRFVTPQFRLEKAYQGVQLPKNNLFSEPRAESRRGYPILKPLGWPRLGMVRSVLLVVASALLSPCLARVATVSVTEEGLSTTLIADGFGIAAGGYINFDVKTNEEEEGEANGNNLTRCVLSNRLGLGVLVCAKFVLRTYDIRNSLRRSLLMTLWWERGQSVPVDVAFPGKILQNGRPEMAPSGWTTGTSVPTSATSSPVDQ